MGDFPKGGGDRKRKCGASSFGDPRAMEMGRDGRRDKRKSPDRVTRGPRQFLWIPVRCNFRPAISSPSPSTPAPRRSRDRARAPPLVLSRCSRDRLPFPAHDFIRTALSGLGPGECVRRLGRIARRWRVKRDLVRAPVRATSAIPGSFMRDVFLSFGLMDV